MFKSPAGQPMLHVKRRVVPSAMCHDSKIALKRTGAYSRTLARARRPVTWSSFVGGNCKHDDNIADDLVGDAVRKTSQ